MIVYQTIITTSENLIENHIIVSYTLLVHTHWFHHFGVPIHILSDQGEKFLKVMSSVCGVLGIHHIKITPYHPRRINEFCEGQYKILTSELHIRSTYM